MKNFTQLYSRADFSLLKKVITLPNFNAYQIISTNLHRHFLSTALINGKEVNAAIEIYTLAEAYILHVWEKALTATLKKFPDFTHHSWSEENLHPIKELVFHSSNRKEAEYYFFQQFADLSNSGTVKVSEGVNITNDKITVYVNEGIITQAIESKLLMQLEGQHEHYAFKTRDFTLGYPDIETHLCYFDNHLLRLFNMNECIKQITILDKQFLNTAEYCNLNAALHLLNTGANINAISEFGDTAITLAVQCAGDEFQSVYNSCANPTLLWNKHPKLIMANEKAKDYIDALLHRGADINMFGQDGSSPLSMTTYTGNHVLMKYLLENGADPNLTLNPAEEYSWHFSDVLQSIYPPPGCTGTDDSIVEIMKEMLLEAGAR